MIVEAMRGLEQGRLTATPQPEQGANYAAKIAKEEAQLDFSLSANALARKVWAFNPAPGAAAVVDGVTIKFWQAAPLAVETASPPGQVLAANAQEGVLIACGDGVLRVDELQKPGGKRLSVAEFLKGFPLEGRKFS
jgi:methionyl-tRNA formyltransferase